MINKNGKNRSARGKRRLAIVQIIFAGIALAIILVGVNKVRNVLKEVTEIVETPTPQILIMPDSPNPSEITKSPTKTPTNTPIPTPTGIPVQESYLGPFINADTAVPVCLKHILVDTYGELVMEDGVLYRVSPEGMLKALTEDKEGMKCRPITYSEVGPGDIAVYGSVIAICLGNDETGRKIFYYTGEKNLLKWYGIEDIGAFAGYSQEETYDLFCGCVPIPKDLMYFDTGFSDKGSDYFTNLISEYFRGYNEIYNDRILFLLNNQTTAASTLDEERYAESFWPYDMRAESWVYAEGYPTKTFLEVTKVSGYDLPYSTEYPVYTFYPVGEKDDYKVSTETSNLFNYYFYDCQFISLDKLSFLQVSGMWEQEYCFSKEKPWIDGVMYGFFNNHHVSFGCVRKGSPEDPDYDKNRASAKGHEDSDKYSVNEEGNTEYKVTDEATIVLGDEDSSSGVYVNPTIDELIELYEGSGRIINRDLGAYFRGEYYYETDGTPYFIKGEWISLLTGEVVGFEDETIETYYYTYFPEDDEYMCFYDYYSEGNVYYAKESFNLIEGHRWLPVFEDGVLVELDYDPNYPGYYQIEEVYGDLYVSWEFEPNSLYEARDGYYWHLIDVDQASRKTWNKVFDYYVPVYDDEGHFTGFKLEDIRVTDYYYEYHPDAPQPKSYFEDGEDWEEE